MPPACSPVSPAMPIPLGKTVERLAAAIAAEYGEEPKDISLRFVAVQTPGSPWWHVTLSPAECRLNDDVDAFVRVKMHDVRVSVQCAIEDGD